MPRARSSSAAGSASRRWRSGAASSPPGASPSGRCSASAIAITRAAWSSSAARRSGSPARTVTPGIAATSPICSPAMLEGRLGADRRRLLVRPAGDARGRAGDVRGARGRGGAGDGIADGLRIRRLLRLRDAASRPAATCGSASTAPSSAPPMSRPRWSRGRDTDERVPAHADRPLRHRARPPDHQRVRNLRRDRRPARLRRRRARALPVQRLRLEDDHAGSAGRQSAAPPLGGAGGDGQLDRAAQQGSGGLSRRRPAAARRSAGAADRLGDGDQRRGVRARSSPPSPSATRSRRSSSTSPARTSIPA